MAKAKEFTITIEDKPGALGKCFLALGERGVNILAFQSYVEEGESLARILVDDSASAKLCAGQPAHDLRGDGGRCNPAGASSGRVGPRSLAAGRKSRSTSTTPTADWSRARRWRWRSSGSTT